MFDQKPFFGEVGDDTSTVELGVTLTSSGGCGLETVGYEVTVSLPAVRKRRWSFHFAGESISKVKVLITTWGFTLRKCVKIYQAYQAYMYQV